MLQKYKVSKDHLVWLKIRHPFSPFIHNMSDAKMPVDTASESKDVAQGQMFNHSDGDIAAAYADALDGENAYTAAEEKRLRWKLDLRLVPILWLNITLAAMDKVTTSTAALYGMRDATGLTGNRYSWVGSAFYVSQCPLR